MSALVAILVVLVAWNPPLFAERSPGAGQRRRLGWLVAAAALLILAAAVAPILDLLDVSVPTFRTAAGAVVAVVGARWLIGPAPRPGEGDQLGHGLMDGAAPEIAAAALAAATEQWILALVGIAVALGLTLAGTTRPLPAATTPWLRRLLGAAAVALGIVLVYAGIRAV